jgi:hypothetical protein
MLVVVDSSVFLGVTAHITEPLVRVRNGASHIVLHDKTCLATNTPQEN